MDNRYSPYGQIFVQMLGQLMKGGQLQPPQPEPPSQNPPEPFSENPPEPSSQNSPEEFCGKAGRVYFAEDETGSAWRREERVELLAEFCREGYPMARRHGHFLIGEGSQGSFIAVPGRFLLDEQPAGGVTGFTLWQPLAGGEELYDTLETIGEREAKSVYGYWIARLDPETLKLSEV